MMMGGEAVGINGVYIPFWSQERSCVVFELDYIFKHVNCVDCGDDDDDGMRGKEITDGHLYSRISGGRRNEEPAQVCTSFNICVIKAGHFQWAIEVGVFQKSCANEPSCTAEESESKE